MVSLDTISPCHPYFKTVKVMQIDETIENLLKKAWD